MKVAEILQEEVQIEPITITNQDGSWLVSTKATKSATIDALTKMVYKIDGLKSVEKLTTKSGKETNYLSFAKNRPNGFIVKFKDGKDMDLNDLLHKAQKSVERTAKAKADHKAKEPERRKAMAAFKAADRKEDLKKYDELYGKGTWNRVTYKQEGGDDGYQYVLRVDGKAKFNGLTRREAMSYKTSEVNALAKKEKLGKYKE